MIRAAHVLAGFALAASSSGQDRLVVELGARTVVVRIAPSERLGRGGSELVELMAWEPFDEVRDRPSIGQVEAPDPASPGAQQIELPRFVDGRDRMWSGFAVRDAGGVVRGVAYAGDPGPEVAGPRQPITWPKSKKGLTCPVDLDDVAGLGAAQVAINIRPNHAFLPDGAAAPGAEFELDIEGEVLRFDPGWVHALDAQVRTLSTHGAMVVAIVTVAVPNGAGNEHPLVHPHCDIEQAPNHLSAFRVTDRMGVAHFVGFLRFVAERYSRDDAPLGRIGGYVIGNEVDAHHEWHNLGDAHLDVVVAQLARELRLASLTVRSIHRDLRVFTSLTHAWNAPHRLAPGRSLPGRTLLEALCRHPESEGVDWHVAFHPYPSNLFEPRFWNDPDAWFALDTPKITFRNLEVLVDAMSRPEFGGGRRHVLLTEQGFHCPDGPDGEDLQAAAYALAWSKVEGLDGIDGFLLHRHVDHRNEGGLRLGLWSCDPDAAFPSTPLVARRMHEVFTTAGTDRFESTAAFALPIVGLRAWGDAVVRTGPFPAHDPIQHPAECDDRALYLDGLLADAELRDVASYEARVVATERGALRGFLLHPAPGGRPALASVPIDVDGSARLRFLIAKLGTGGDGVRCFVRLGDVELWSAAADAAGPLACEVAIPGTTSAARRRRTLTFGVDALGDTSWDQAVWLAPRIVADAPR